MNILKDPAAFAALTLDLYKGDVKLAIKALADADKSYPTIPASFWMEVLKELVKSL